MKERCLITLHPPIAVDTVVRVLNAVIRDYPSAMVEPGEVYRIMVVDGDERQAHSYIDVMDLGEPGGVQGADHAHGDATSGGEPSARDPAGQGGL